MPDGVRCVGVLLAASFTAGVSTTRTASSPAALPFALSSSPCRYNRRQANTWLAFTPCARATQATDAPGSNVSSTTRRFSSRECRRRGTLLITLRSEVSTYPPSGHNRKCPLGAYLRQPNIIRHHGHNRTLTNVVPSALRACDVALGNQLFDQVVMAELALWFKEH